MVKDPKFPIKDESDSWREENLIEESGNVSADKKEAGERVELKEGVEKKDLTPKEVLDKKIRQKIESMDVDDSLKMQAQTHANDIKFLDDQKKIKKLLEIAKKKGVVFAVHVAKKMKHADPYILDTFHDILAKEGYYKEFLK